MNRIVLVFLTILGSLCMVLPGCGGGTTGTDNGGVRSFVRGQIVDATSVPLAGVTVVLEESGDSALSDASGTFEIETSFSGDSFSLRLINDQLDSSVQVASELRAATVVTVSLVADTQSKVIEVVSISIEAIDDTPDTDTPSISEPTPTAAPGVTPTPQPDRSIFKGTLVFRDDVPVPGATITITETSASSSTDRSGSFRIETRIVSGNVQMRVAIGSIRDSVTLPNIPKRPVIVTVKLKLNLDSDLASFDPNGRPTDIDTSVASISIQDRK